MKTLNKMNVHFSSASDDWRTPSELFAVLDKEFTFTLDAACSRENSLCGHGYTKEMDAFTADWVGGSQRLAGGRGAVWLNPPYSRGLQARFIQKARDESAKFQGPIVCCLIPARPDTAIWQSVIFPCASEIRFIKGRLRFVGAPASAPFPSAVVIFGQDNDGQKITGWNWRAAK